MGAKIIVHHHPAKKPQHDETIVLVHHMLGNHRTTVRHQHWLNSIGYNCVSFDLVLGSSNWKSSISPIALYSLRGVFRMWREQISKVLNQISGDKIIFAFSGPSLSALLACEKRKDVKKIICDGGPFANVEENTRNLFKIELGLQGESLVKLCSYIGAKLWGPQSLKELQRVLESWPQDRPILSIRGAEDPIVPEPSIDAVFSPIKDLPIKVLKIPGGGHLDGLKSFSESYKETTSEFLLS